MKTWFFDRYPTFTQVFSLQKNTPEGEVENSFYINETDDSAEDLVEMLNEYERLKDGR